jgi:hypothetical protein
MADLRPYHSPGATKIPLTGGARFIRGFRRIGMVLGAIAFVVGMAITVFIAVDQQRSADNRFAQASCINDRVRNGWPIKMSSYDASKIDFSATGCPGYSFYSETLPVVLSYAKQIPGPLQHAAEPLLYGSLITVSSAALIFFGLWLVGWLCAGFTRD